MGKTQIPKPGAITRVGCPKPNVWPTQFKPKWNDYFACLNISFILNSYFSVRKKKLIKILIKHFIKKYYLKNFKKI